MKVAVITPYYQTPTAWLKSCHQSVRSQTHPCTHILIADGIPDKSVKDFDTQHIVLARCHHDYGDTPRAVATISAIAQGFDAIAYLDSDNWFYADHIESLVKLHESSGASVVTSARMLHRLDGTVLGRCPHVDGETFVDTSCIMLTRPAFSLATVWWAMRPELHAIDDRVIWAHVKSAGMAYAFTGKPTAAYRTAFRFHYELFGEKAPSGSKSGDDIGRVIRWLRPQSRDFTEVLTPYLVEHIFRERTEPTASRAGVGRMDKQ